MLRFMKRIARKPGLSPGSLVHVGEKKAERVRMRIIDYDEENLEETDLATIEDSFPYKDKSTLTRMEDIF